MKKLTYSLLMLLLVAVGCSKSNNDDPEQLLKTVPADASSVVMVNMANIVDKLGCSTDGKTIKLSNDLQKTIDESKALKAQDKQRFKDICNGETGLSISSMAFFSAARSYVTGLLNDPEKFIAYLEKESGIKAVEEDGAKVIEKVAVLGNQFWVCTEGRPDIEQLKYYQQLNDQQSYAVAQAASLLLDPEKVVTYVADVNRTLSLIPQATYIRMASSLIFNDMAYIAGSADLKKTTVTADASVLNSDMKPAELLIPSDKIDASLIKKFDKGADLFVAAAVPEKLTKKISEIVGSMMGSNAKMVESVLGSVDGTVAARLNSSMDDAEVFIQTNGKNFNALSSVLQGLLKLVVTRDGDTLTGVRGSKDFTGSVTPALAADKLKGAWIGVASNGFIARDVVTIAKLSPDKKSLRLEMEVQGGVDAIITAITR